MADITVTVGGIPTSATYSGTGVTSTGKIEVNPGTTTIKFQKATAARWSFNDPAITFSPAGPFTVASNDASQVTISDADPAAGEQTYEYTLKTTAGDFDPQIINKGRI